jgi:hypothetical protein
MNSEQISSLIRSILLAVGGFFVGKGIVDTSTMETIVSALVTLGMASWGIFAKTDTAKVASAAAVPGVAIQAPPSIANAIPATNVTSS